MTELRDSTFYATITIQQDGGEIEVDSRPSDAIALAVRAEAPIFADDRVIEESAIEFEGEEVNEEEIVDEFRKFLDQVTPEEFASELAEDAGRARSSRRRSRRRRDEPEEDGARTEPAGYESRPRSGRARACGSSRSVIRRNG